MYAYCYVTQRKKRNVLFRHIPSSLSTISLFLVQDDSIGPDPFFDLEQHALLGVANIFLECLFHGVLHEYDAPIIGPTGKVSSCASF